jgi:hypothetical protein
MGKDPCLEGHGMSASFGSFSVEYVFDMLDKKRTSLFSKT